MLDISLGCDFFVLSSSLQMTKSRQQLKVVLLKLGFLFRLYFTPNQPLNSNGFEIRGEGLPNLVELLTILEADFKTQITYPIL